MSEHSELPEGTWALLQADGGVSLRRTAAPPAAPADAPLERPASERESLLAALLRAPDPVVRERLYAVGRGFSWHTGGDEQTAALTDTLRDDLAQTRVFGSLDASPLLPECAANIAHRLAPRLADGDEVLAHEGQALVALALARRGHRAALWTQDEGVRAFVNKLPDDVPLTLVDADVLAPLDGEMRARFALVLIDTLHDDAGTTALLSRAHHALADGGHVVALAHPMRRELLAKSAAQAGLALSEPFDEIAVRLLAGFSPAEFVWDERVLAAAGEPAVAPDDTLTRAGARDLDATERKHGCVEVLALAAEGMSAARVDRAIETFARADGAPVHTDGHDEDGVQHVRHLALARGGHAAITVHVQEGRAAVDVFPWSPARLARLCAALLCELPRAAEEVPLGQ
jgi:hypothetical protein